MRIGTMLAYGVQSDVRRRKPARMRILNVTAQKPDSTGSGTYLSEMVRCMDAAGHETAVICGMAKGERPCTLPAGTRVYAVEFDSNELPFHVCGMSNSMPYPSTRYIDLSPGMCARFEAAFVRAIDSAFAEFSPDIVICHHLYLASALVRREASRLAPDVPVGVVCHSTDLRQMSQHRLERDLIVRQMREMDAVFALHAEQAAQIVETYGVDPDRICVLGTGYNAQIFRPAPLRLIYAGKIWRKKGVASLLEAIDRVKLAGGRSLELRLAGGHSGSEEEYRAIVERAKACVHPVEFLGRLDQPDLAHAYQQADVFVLPSFFEGLPLVAIEALACGCVDVLTDLPGVRPWLEENAPDASVEWVTPPRMVSIDEPDPADLPAFEERLARAIERAAQKCRTTGDVSALTWERVTDRAIERLSGR